MTKDPAATVAALFDLPPWEGTCNLEAVGEALPAWLRGTCYFNGPGVFRKGDLAYRHWLDGDGIISAIAFEADAVRFTRRFVASTKRQDEEAAGAALYRTFGTAFEGDRLRRGLGLESPVNVSAVPFAGTLLAFGEQGLPWSLDPVTLETRGEHTFGGRLNAISPLSAHPSLDPVSGEMFNFGLSYAARRPLLNLYRFAADGELLSRRRVPLPYPCSMHDFGLSQRHATFYVNPHLLDVAALMAEGRSVMDCLSWEPERGSELLVVERDTGQEAARLEIPGRACLHHIHSFEAEGLLFMDLLELDEPAYEQYQPLPTLYATVAPGRPTRFVIDLAAGRLVDTRRLDYDAAPDFPSVDPRFVGEDYDDFWFVGISRQGEEGPKFFDQLCHLRWSDGARDLWTCDAGGLLAGEPIFAGEPDRPGEGLVICHHLDVAAKRSELLLFDAQAIAAGPRHRLPLPAPMTSCFHGVAALQER